MELPTYLNVITLACLLRRSLTENSAGASFDILHFKTIVILLHTNASEGGDLPTFRIIYRCRRIYQTIQLAAQQYILGAPSAPHYRAEGRGRRVYLICIVLICSISKNKVRKFDPG